MEAEETLVTVFGGIFAVLALASLLGLALKWGISPQTPHATLDNLNARLGAWWMMIVLLALAFWGGKPTLIILFALVSFQCLREFVPLTRVRSGDHRVLLWCFLFFLPLQYSLVAVDWYELFTLLIPVYAFLLLPMLAALGNDTTHFLARVAQIQWGLMICVYCLSHLPALMTLAIPGYAGRNLLLLLFLMLVVQSSDVLQYLWGKLYGRRKLAPLISPSKTLEGLVGGILSSSALGASLWWITPFNLWQAGLIALLINVMGFFGGFVLSAIKRERGIKNWGNLVNGHGGLLDRVDSLSFAAPVFFHIVRYGWTD